MIIIGHDLIEFKPLYQIKNSDDISKLPPNSTVVFEFGGNEKLIKYCHENNINFAVKTDSIKEALLANAAGASYIISSFEAAAIQELAQNYLFDAKILLKIDCEDEMEEAAKNNIDGVLLPRGIINGSF